MQCDECQTENPTTAKFCLGCGARIQSAAVRPSAERRPMHVVFCDVVGSTPLSEQLDPEDLRGLLHDVQQICAAIVGRFEGYIAQFLGDGALVYFGYPHARDDDARRAVRAGLEIVRAVSREPIRGHRVRVRVGIHSGLVVVGEVGVPGRRTELAVGETPNVAARVQSEAEPDTVVISQATERLVRGFFSTEALGPRSLRGLRQAVALFSVVGETGARDRLDVAKAAGLTSFVGRSEEMTALARHWGQAERRHGRVVSIRGEAGVGKSRLVETFRSTLAAGAAETIHCGCSDYLRNTAFHPFAVAIEHEMRLAGSDTVRSPEWLGQYSERFGMPVPEAARVLSDLLGQTFDAAAPVGDLSPAARRQLTMNALSHWLSSEPPQGPKLVILEDVHWADASTLELVDAVASKLESRAVLVVLTLRPEFAGGAAVGHPAEVIALRPLGRADASRMALHVAHGKSLPQELTNRLEEWTKGVPLYIEEFTKGLLESGALVERAGAFELTAAGLPQGLVPETLAGPLTARIHCLSTAKPVAQLASVVGLEFRYDMLAVVSGWTEGELRAALERLVAAELVIHSPAEPGQVYQFRHALLRDAAYRSLLLADRREMHRRIVSALQSQFHEFADNRPEVVAVHASEAGLPELAVAEWQRALERALARAANWEALAHIDEGMRQLEQLAESHERTEKQLAFELARGPALMAVRGFQAVEVLETYLRAQELSTKLGDPRRLFWTLWGLWADHFVAGELLPAREYAEQVMSIARISEQPNFMVPACHALGYTLCYAAEYERALEIAKKGIALFDIEQERANTRILQFSSTVALRHFAANSLWMLGFPDEARTEAAEAIALAEVLAHPPSLAYAQSALTWGVPFLVDDYEAVNRAALRATELSRDEQFSLWPPLVKAFRGWSTFQSGAAGRGLSEMQEGFAAFRAFGGGILRTTMHALIARAQWQTGDAAGALQTVAAGLAEAARTDEHNYEPELHRVRGEILSSAASGALRADAEAEASLREALALTRRQSARTLELRAAASLATFLAARGDEAEAALILQQASRPHADGRSLHSAGSPET